VGSLHASAGRSRSCRWRVCGYAASSAAASLVLCTAPAAARASFQLGLQDSGLTTSPGNPGLVAAYAALQKFDGTTVRIVLPWSQIAPQGNTKPAGFDASNPSDPHYSSWPDTADIWVKAAVAHHARVILEVVDAPNWAQGTNRPSCEVCTGDWDVNATELGEFMHAAAVRYSGQFPDPADPGTFLPHVSDWEIWNEENLPEDLMAPNLAQDYRAMLNASYAAIKSVDPRAVVAIGGLAPVSFLPGRSVSPLKLAAQLLCLHRVGTRFLRNRTCPDPARFDVLAIHPYTLAATPTKHAYHYDDVLVGDMGKVSALIRAADRLHTVGGPRHHGIWVTEWSWFTKPPNECVGDRWARAARYVAWSMYEMWRAGVTLVTWLGVRDPALTEYCSTPSFTVGGGLYASDGRPKPMLRAFAFPFVAGVDAGSGFAWGRVPVSGRVVVVVLRRAGRRWVLVIRATAASDGTFYVRFGARGAGVYRASVVDGPVSVPYNSTPIPPRRTHAFYSG
jgi:hypothetical protein